MARKRILFIDSDDGFVKDVATSARKLGFDAIVTGSSTDGVEQARQERPDLIVVNVELAPTNGWSVCTKLKKDDDLKDIPVILTSSLSTPDTFEKHKKLKTRADEYLIKPYASEELVQLASALVGAPDPSDLVDEDVVVEDETLSTGDFDMAGLDEEIPVLGDEPLADGLEASLEPGLEASFGDEGETAVSVEAEPELEALPANDEAAFDPLASVTETTEAPVTDDLADLPSDFGDLSGDLADVSALQQDSDLASFDDSFASLGETETALPEGSLAPNAFADLAGDLDTSEESLEAAIEPSPTVEALTAETSESESPFNAEEFSFDEAPLEMAADSEEAPLEASLADLTAEGSETDFAAEFGAEPASFSADPLGASAEFTGDSFGSFGDPARVAELESRVAELEAEIEGYKATESTHDAEIERLRQEGSARSRELQELRDQLRDRETSILDLKDSESKLNLELTKARDERVRRDAAMKALTQKAEQMSVLGKRLERDLLVAKEELKGVPALKARVTELETAQQEASAAAETARQELEAARAEIETTKSSLETVQAEKATLEADKATAEADKATAERALTEAKVELETAQAAKSSLEDELRDAKGSLESAQGEKSALETQLAELKAALEKVESEKAELAERATSAEAKAQTLQTQTQTANERAARAREALRLAVEHLAHEGESSTSV